MTAGGSERILQVAFHESAMPERFAARMVEGLRARALPGEWLYHYPAQARLWLAYHQAYSPSRADSAMAGLYREAFAAAAEAVRAAGGGPLHAVSLGCGGGQKDAELLAIALRTQRNSSPAAKTQPGEPSLGVYGREPPRGIHERETPRGVHERETPLGVHERDPPRYTPVDASPALALEAALHVGRRFPHLSIRPLVADLSAGPDLASWLDGIEGRPTVRLFTCFGMVPNMDPVDFPAYLGGLVGAPGRSHGGGDGLLVSANLSPGGMVADRERILTQYDNPPARAWYMAALEALGIRPAEVVLSVQARPLDGLDSTWRIEVEARLTRKITLQVFGAEIPLSAGERLRVFHSNRFTAAAFRRVLERAGLNIQGEWLHPSGEEGIFHCKGAQGQAPPGG